MIGASGAIFGVAVAFAWYWPDHPVSLFPLPDPVAAKWLVTFLIGVDLVLALLKVSDGIAHIAHLGGIGTALLWLKGQDWRATRGERRGREPATSSGLVSQPPRGSRGGATPPATPAPQSRGGADGPPQAAIDRVPHQNNAGRVGSL